MNWRDVIVDVDMTQIKIKVAKMSYERFEYYVGDILKYDGFNLVMVTDYSGDYGADLIIEKNGIRTAVQTKYTRTTKISLIAAIQEAVTARAYYKCHNSMVVTNGPAPNQGIKLAELNNCRIIAGSEFWSLAEKHETKCSQQFSSTVSKRLLRKAKSK